MRVLSVAILLAIVLATYAGGVSYTGKQAEQLLETELDRLEQVSPVPVALNLEGRRGFFDSRYRLEIELNDPSPELKNLLAGDIVPLQIDVDNGFFTSNFVIRLEPGLLLERLQGWQQHPQREPLLIHLQHRLDPFHRQLSHDLQLETDSFQGRSGEQGFSLGALNLEAKLDQGHFTSRADLGPLEIQQVDQILTLDGLSLEQSARLKPGTDIYSGQYEEAHSRLTLAPLLMDGSNSRVQIQSVGLDLVQHGDAGRVFLDSLAQIGFARLESKAGGKPLNLKNLQLNTRLSLDGAAVENLSRQLSRMTPLQAQNPLMIMPLLDGIIRQGVELQLNQLRLQLQQGGLDATGRFELAAIGLDQLLTQPEQLDRHLLLELDTVFDPAMVAEISPDPAWQQQLDDYLAMGLLKQEGARLSSRVMLSNGELTVNGIPMGGH